ncbi:polysaccharide biosynthesis/export family protein [Desulfomicrobium salsuginis]
MYLCSRIVINVRKLSVLALALVLAVAFSANFGLAKEYVIGGGDKLQIFVWGEPELSVLALVRPDGRISLPGAGELMAEGLTPEDLQKEVTAKLASLVKNPLVTVSMAEICNSKVYIIGGGVPSGTFDLRQKTTLLQLLAGMDLTRADLKGAHVMRGPTRLDRDFDRLLHQGDMSQDIALENNDVIFFPALPEPYIYVLGAVNAPRALAFKEGMTVMDALLESGGFNKFAKRNDTVIVRRENGGEKRIRVRAQDLAEGKDLTQNVLLQRGDYIIASEGFF